QSAPPRTDWCSASAYRICELIFAQSGMLHRMPLTVHYSKNLAYQPDKVVSPSTVSERTIASTAVVQGKGVFPATRTPGFSQGDFIHGTAVFKVGQWLKGSGPAEIKVDKFGAGPDCLPPLQSGETVILFLGEMIGTDHYTLVKGATYPERVVSSWHAFEIMREVGHAPTVLSIGGMPLTQSTFFYGIAFSLLVLVLILAGLAFLIRRSSRK
ncbi:MAG: hypothetical protein AAF485_21430, partial [Chloroflexota bacterium]